MLILNGLQVQCSAGWDLYEAGVRGDSDSAGGGCDSPPPPPPPPPPRRQRDPRRHTTPASTRTSGSVWPLPRRTTPPLRRYIRSDIRCETVAADRLKTNAEPPASDGTGRFVAATGGTDARQVFLQPSSVSDSPRQSSSVLPVVLTAVRHSVQSGTAVSATCVLWGDWLEVPAWK